MKVNQVGDFSAIVGVRSKPTHLQAVKLAFLFTHVYPVNVETSKRLRLFGLRDITL